MEYDNNNRGALFKNERRDDEKFPHYKGSLNVEGVDFWISAWLKESKDGAKFMSLSIKSKDQKEVKAPAKRSLKDDFEDAPF
jgi:uncharacterized protein (DUF736 family)